MNHLISKSRRPKFEVSLTIYDLNNVPLASGTSFVKWHLPSSATAETRGRTEKIAIQDHSVTWDYNRTFHIRVPMDKSNTLQEVQIHFEIIQDYSSGGGRSEKITLGNITLNLAEYVEPTGQDGDEDGVIRRYLMQDSKINSTLKVGINMKQLDGDKNFVAPPLKTAPMFGGIAGIMGTAEAAEGDDAAAMPSLNRTREAGELQDMYRKALAAHWAAQAGELPADECVEDIFSGGDGWRSKHKQDNVPKPRAREPHGYYEVDDTDWTRWHKDISHLAGVENLRATDVSHDRWDSISTVGSKDTVTGRTVDEDGGRRVGGRSDRVDMRGHGHGNHGEGHHRHGHHHRPAHSYDKVGNTFDRDGYERVGLRRAVEINELQARQDLLSWQLPGMAVKKDAQVAHG